MLIEYYCDNCEEIIIDLPYKISILRCPECLQWAAHPAEKTSIYVEL